MKRKFRAAVLAIIGAAAMSLNVYAAEPVDGQVIDGSVLTHEESVEAKSVFDWNFEEENEIVPFGAFYSSGRCGMSKESSTSVYITAATNCYSTCNSVNAEVTLQKLSGGRWHYVTSRSKTKSNTDYVKVSDTVSVSSGYYYRVTSTHSATKNGKTESGAATSNSLYVG